MSGAGLHDNFRRRIHNPVAAKGRVGEVPERGCAWRHGPDGQITFANVTDFSRSKPLRVADPRSDFRSKVELQACEERALPWKLRIKVDRMDAVVLVGDI
jgi:hypothetical protein